MHYGDLGVYRLLASASRGQMEEFQGKVLGSLLAYDRKRHGQLTPTLETYVRSANAAEAAARLNLHRNSLLYRLRRIREITGLDLDDPDTRFALQLAFRVRETLRVTEP
jgi:DNA-binding PucR family transcriptional regulator